MNKRNLIISLAFPIIVLFSLVVYKHTKVIIGKEIILPISGFDPRDILSGHYLVYTIDYGIRNDEICDRNESTDGNAYICIEKDSDDPDKYISSLYPETDSSETVFSGCYAFIKGKCINGRFIAGIEKFYVPEEFAVPLDSAVRNRKGKIVLSVTGKGSAAVKDLLIEGKSWKEYKEVER